jgi:hypothetical protein
MWTKKPIGNGLFRDGTLGVPHFGHLRSLFLPYRGCFAMQAASRKTPESKVRLPRIADAILAKAEGK